MLLSHQTVSVGRRVADDELVLRRAAGVLAGLDGQGAAGGNAAFAAANGVLVKRMRAEVPVHGGGLQPDPGQAGLRVAMSRFGRRNSVRIEGGIG